MKQELKIEQLAKILALTNSTNDNEALAAIRKANFFLSETNTVWAELLETESSKKLLDLQHKHNLLLKNFNELVVRYRTLAVQVLSAQQRPAVTTSYRRRSRRF